MKYLKLNIALAFIAMRVTALGLKRGNGDDFVFDGVGRCLRCKRSLAGGQDHTTEFAPSVGISPLCESCWGSLGTPEARLPFYSRYFELMLQNGSILTTQEWRQIEAAVMAGK